MNKGAETAKREEKETEEELRIPQQYKDLRSEAQERRTLFKKYKKILGEEERLSNFKEPAAILLRRSGQGEWLEGVTKGKYAFTHSDGSRRFIIITGKPNDMRYAGRLFKLYVLHEDFPIPIPEDPLITTEQVSLMLEQALIGSQKIRAKDWEGKNNMIKIIIWGIIGLIVAVIVYKLVVPANPQVAQTIAETVKENITNASTIIKDARPAIPI